MAYEWTPEQITNAQAFFAGNPTPEQVYQTAQQYQLNPTQLGSLWSQATGGDYQAGLAGINQYLQTTGQTLSGGLQQQMQPITFDPGITSLTPTAKADLYNNLLSQGYTDPQIRNAVTQQFGAAPSDVDWSNLQNLATLKNTNTVEGLYQNVLGRAADPEGLAYWKSTFGDVIDPTEIAAFKTAAAPELVSSAYKTVLGREAEQAGIDYWIQQLRSGAISPQNFQEQLAYAAQGTDRPAAQTYLGKEVWAPTEYLKGTSGLGYQDVIDYISANISDPVKVAQAATQYGIDPNEILQAYQSKGESPYTLQQIQNYLTEGQSGFAPRFQEMVGSTLGSAEEQLQLQQILQAQTRNPNASLADFYSPEKFSGMSLENIEKELRDSPVNKLQEALRLSKIAKSVLGYTDEAAADLVKKAYKGEIGKDTAESNIYNTLLDKNNISGADYEKLMTYAAVKNPDAPVFKENPMLLTAYTPLDKKTGTTGQYGYYNDAPVLNANFAVDKLGDKNQTEFNLVNANDFGWVTRSKYAGDIKRGVALFGVGFSDKNEIEKAVAIEQGLKNGSIQQDPESGNYYSINSDGTVNSIGTLKSENTRQEYNPYSENTLQKLQQAATQVGLDPSKYKSAGELYDAVEAKTGNLYQVTGRAIDWDPEIAKKLGITQTTTGRGGVNHASVLYRQVGDKLVAISPPKAFEFHDPNTSRGFFGDIAGGIASIPFVAEIAAYAIPGAQPFYPLIKGAQTAALGGSAEDVLKSAGIAWLAPKVANAVGGPEGIRTLLPEGTPDLIVKGASNAAANVAVNAGIAALTGKDIGDAVSNALMASVVQTGAGQLPFIETIPQEYRSIVTRAIADIALGSDLQKALQKAITTYGMKTAKTAA